MGTRPWTTGEFGILDQLPDESDSGGTTATVASIDGFLREGGCILRRSRSADGATIPSPLLMTDVRETTAMKNSKDDSTAIPAQADEEEKASRTEGAASNNGGGDESIVGVAGDGQQEQRNAVTDAGVPGDDDNHEGMETPAAAPPPQQAARRVSFADESGLGDPATSSTDGSEQPSRPSQHGDGWGAQRRRMSSLVGSSSGGYLGGDGGTYDLGGEPTRRSSHIERCNRAMELARAAHELLFTDTRPDGLRPITGSPMLEGRGTPQGPGALFVGLSGIRGFDLSFVGAARAEQSGAGQSLTSVASRLSASRRLSARAGGGESSGTAAEAPPPSAGDINRASSPSLSRAGASWIAQGFLLDRKPGSLVPRVPRSPPGRNPVPAEAGQTPRARDRGTAGPADDGDTERQAGTENENPTAAQNGDSAVSTVPSSDYLRQAQAPAAEEDINAAGGRYSSSLTGQGDSLDGSEQDGSTSEERGGGSRGAPRSRVRGNMRGSESSLPEVPAGTTVVSSAATAMAAMFAPKAAVLWSARDLGVEELVLSGSGDQEVKRKKSKWRRRKPFESIMSVCHVSSHTREGGRVRCLFEGYHTPGGIRHITMYLFT